MQTQHVSTMFPIFQKMYEHLDVFLRGNALHKTARPEAPDFVNLPGSLVLPHPFLEQEAKFFNFIFKSDMHALQQVCDRWFNHPSKGKVHYRPLTADIITTFAYNGKALSLYDEASFNVGSIGYHELMFSFFVLAIKKEAGRWVAEQCYAFIPYIFVDSDRAMAVGREIFGFPKSIAQIELPATPESPLHFSASTNASQHFSPQSKVELQPLVSLRSLPDAPTDNSAQKITELWHDAGQAFKEIKKLVFTDREIALPGIELMLEIGNFIKNNELPFLTLKQSRDVHDGGKAAYQAILESYCKMARFSGAGLLGNNFEMTIHSLDSYPIAKDLGLNGAGQQPRAAFWLAWDYVFGNGREVWRAI